MPERSSNDEPRTREDAAAFGQDQGPGGRGPAADPQAAAEDLAGVAGDRGDRHRALGRGGAGSAGEEAAAPRRDPPGPGPAADDRHRGHPRGEEEVARVEVLVFTIFDEEEK